MESGIYTTPRRSMVLDRNLKRVLTERGRSIALELYPEHKDRIEEISSQLDSLSSVALEPVAIHQIHINHHKKTSFPASEESKLQLAIRRMFRHFSERLRLFNKDGI